MDNNDNINKNLKPSDNENLSLNYPKCFVVIICIVLSFLLGFFINKQKIQKVKKDNPTIQTDFGPYMSDFQKKIKLNWTPPHKDTSKIVVLLITIDKNGYVVKNTVKKSSGDEEIDNAAIEAVNKSEPFDALPSTYNENTVDIQFTFSYNIFNTKK